MKIKAGRYLPFLCFVLLVFVISYATADNSLKSTSTSQIKNLNDDLHVAEDYWKYNNLGHNYALSGKYDEAIEAYQKSIEVVESLKGESWPDVSPEEMARINRERRNFKQIFARYGLIEALEKIGSYQEALEHVDWLSKNQKIKGKEEPLKQKLEKMKQNLFQKIKTSSYHIPDAVQE